MKKIRLGDVVSFSKGQQINGDELMKKGRYYYLNGGINPSGCWNDFNVTGDTVTVSEGGNSCGYVNYMSYPFWCGAHCYYLYDSKLNNKYLYYALKSQQEKIMKLRTGACMPNIKKNDLGKFELYITTDINAQELTVFILDKITDLIDKRKKQLEKLDELVKSRFIEMFGDCVHNDRGWRAKTVERVCKGIYGGGTPSKAHSEYYENGNIPWVSSKDMKTDILTDSQVHINQLGIDNSTAQLVPVNSVIMVIRSGILKHTLPVAINAVPITVNQDLKVFIPNNEILARFLAVQFKMHEKDILAGVRAVTADNIEFNSLKQRELIVPPIEFQQKYVSFLEQIDKSKFEIKQSLEKLELLKKALMQKYFG